MPNKTSIQFNPWVWPYRVHISDPVRARSSHPQFKWGSIASVCHPRFVNPVQTLADLSFVFMWGPKLMTSTFIHFRESGARLHPDALFADAKTRKSPPRQRTEAEASSTP